MDVINTIKTIKPINDILSSDINKDNINQYFSIPLPNSLGVTITLSLGDKSYDDEKGILTINLTGILNGISETKLIKQEGFLTKDKLNEKTVKNYINDLYYIGNLHTFL